MDNVLIVNFKNYEQSTGKNALKLAKICDRIAKETGKNIIVAVQHTDIQDIAKKVRIPVYAQHVDDISYGANTGFILPEAVMQAGASGTLLNHSEHQIANIKGCIERARSVGLTTVVCANDVEKGIQVAAFSPDMVAIEPPELIGGDISVSTAKPEVISDAVKRIEGSVIVGAGVKNSSDVKTALSLGAKGILLASGVTKAKNPRKAILDLVSGLG